MSPSTQVAQNAGVSTPTVVRNADPISKRETWAAHTPEAHILNRFSEAVIGNIRQTLTQIDLDAFERCSALLAEMVREKGARVLQFTDQWRPPGTSWPMARFVAGSWCLWPGTVR